MVTVTNYIKRKNKAGEEFIALELQGAVEMIKSTHTGKYYAHAHSATITSTLNEQVCKKLIGTTFPGEIKKVECAEYTYQVPNTTDTITLNHSYVYLAEGANIEEAVFEEAIA